MESCFRELKDKWLKANARRIGHGFGVPIDSWDNPLTNCRFADDVLLMAQSKADIAKMIQHLQDAASKYGLKINFSKTKVLPLLSTSTVPESLRIGDDEI